MSRKQSEKCGCAYWHGRAIQLLIAQNWMMEQGVGGIPEDMVVESVEESLDSCFNHIVTTAEEKKLRTLIKTREGIDKLVEELQDNMYYCKRGKAIGSLL